MADISKVQLKILDDLYKRDIGNDISIRIQPEFYQLEEKDPIMQVRELVFNIDYLQSIDMIETMVHYYDESDSVSIEYLNNAVELHDRRIKLTNLGIQYMEALGTGFLTRITNRLKQSFNRAYKDHPYRVAITHILAFALGAFGMWLLMNFI